MGPGSLLSWAIDFILLLFASKSCFKSLFANGGIVGVYAHFQFCREDIIRIERFLERNPISEFCSLRCQSHCWSRERERERERAFKKEELCTCSGFGCSGQLAKCVVWICPKLSEVCSFCDGIFVHAMWEPDLMKNLDSFDYAVFFQLPN